MPRWEDWHRRRIDPEASPELQFAANKLLGELMADIRRGGLFQGKRHVVLDDGTTITAQFDGTTPMLTVTATATSGGTRYVVPGDLWLPRGFVLVPGGDTAPDGWGLPVIDIDTDNPNRFAAANIDPGLDVRRWTAHGPCGEVLLTQQDTSKYPDPTHRRMPLCFDSSEFHAGDADMPGNVAWHAVRPRFNDFSWDPGSRAQRQGYWAAVIALVGTGLELPFDGFYDDAQLFAYLLATYGTDQTAFPIAYRSTTERANKDGVPLGAGEGWWFGRPTEATMASTLGTPPPKYPSIDFGLTDTTTTFMLRQRDTWLGCGNLYWHPDDAALPTLSWNGYPAQNLPFWLVQGGWTGDTGSDVFDLTGWHYEWRQGSGITRYVYDKNLYANGRRIGVLPDAVIAAAVQTRVATDTDGHDITYDKIVVITWRASDQPHDSTSMNYLYTFRVWFYEVERIDTVPLHLPDPPVGAYDATTNPGGWHDAGTFAAVSGNALGTNAATLWQLWRFSGDGARALALASTSPWAPNYEINLPTWGREAVFQAVVENALSVQVNDVSIPIPQDGSGGHAIAIDYAGGGIAWVRTVQNGIPESQWIDGTTTAIAEAYEWSGAQGTFETSSGCGTSERWVLDARHGAMGFLDHQNVCGSSGGAAAPTYRVRLCRNGARIATDVMADSQNVYEPSDIGTNPQTTSSSFLDRVRMSYGSTRDGQWLFGYDLGVTQNDSLVLSAPTICGQAWPPYMAAPQSAHIASRWLSSIGDVATQCKVTDSPMRGYPIGVV